jgi:hypothetical protein
MNNPKISWQVLEEVSSNEYEYIQYKNYTEEGSFIPGEYITKTIQVWNNYLGMEDVLDASNCKLVLAFKNYEDNFLLNLTKVEILELSAAQFFIDIDRGVIDLGTLSGVANTGSSMNESNYKTIKISIGPLPANMRNELKSLYFYLEYNNE